MRRLAILAGLALVGCHHARQAEPGASVAADEPIHLTTGLSVGPDRWEQTIDFKSLPVSGIRVVEDRPIGDLSMREWPKSSVAVPVAVHIDIKLARTPYGGGMGQYSTEIEVRQSASPGSSSSQATSSTMPSLPKGALSGFVKSLVPNVVGPAPTSIPVCEFTDSVGKKHTIRVDLLAPMR